MSTIRDPNDYPEWLRELILSNKTGNIIHDKMLEKDASVLDLIPKDPKILEHFQKHIGKTVKHDEHTKNITFFTCLSAYIADYVNKFTPLNLFLKGESGSGKTYNVMETIKYFPPKDVWLLGGLSPKALVYQHGTLVDENDVEINENAKPSSKKPRKPAKYTINRLPNESDLKFAERQEAEDNKSKDKFEAEMKEWEAERLAWEEKMKNSKYIVDLSGKILVFLEAPQEETFLMLRPILSHDAKEISFRMTYKGGGGSLQTRNVVLRGWCATIFCTTQVEFLEELSTRSFTASPSATTEKIEDAINLLGLRAEQPWSFYKDRERTYLESYLVKLKEICFGAEQCDSKDNICRNIINPFASHFVKKYPSREVRAMRDIQHILALMNISAMFHYDQRPIMRIGENSEYSDWLMVTSKDFEIVADFLPEIGETTLTGLPQQALDVFNKIAKVLGKDGHTFTYEELVDAYNEKFQKKKSYSFMRVIIKGLSDAGFVTTEQHETDKRKKVIKVLKNPDNPFKIALRDFLGVFTINDLKSWLESCKKNSAKKSVKIYVKNSKEKELPETEIDTLFDKHYSFSSEKLQSMIATDIDPIDEKKGIDSFFTENATSKHISGEKERYIDKYHINYASWIQQSDRKRGTCWICGTGEDMALNISTTTSGNHETCETCAEQVMEELNQEINESDDYNNDDGFEDDD